MAITQISKIQIRSGSTDNIPQLSLGELGWAYTGSDSPQLLIGSGDPTGNVLPNNVKVITELSANIPAGGSNTQLQYSNGGNLGGIPSVTYDNISNVLTLGNVANLRISGGTNGYVLQSLGPGGGLGWTAQTGGGGGNGTPGGATTQVQFNDGGSFGGNTGFTFNKTAGALASPLVDTTAVYNLNGTVVENADLTHGATSALSIPSNGNTTVPAQLNNFYGNVVITSGTDSSHTKSWTFDSTGTLSTPGNISIGSSATGIVNWSATAIGITSDFVNDYTGIYLLKDSDAELYSNSAVSIYSDTSNISYQWAFGQDGNLTLPTNTAFIKYPNGSQYGATTYGNSNVVSLLASFGSNTITTTGNVSVGNIIGNGQALTSIAGANVSGAVSYATTANSVAGSNVSGAVAYATTANAVAGANVSGAVAYATTANSVAGANVSGQVSNALVAGTVYTAAQSNITSLGTLTGLTSGGTVNFTSASNVTLGPVANVHITGGTSGQVLTTNGSNVLSWSTVSGAGNIAITNDTSTNSSFYPTFTSATSGNITGETVSSTKLTFNPSTGFLSATNFNSLSDINYKTNLVKIENALGAVANINGYTFDWLDGTGSDTGVVAQEIELSIPNSVTDIDGRKTVKYSAITAYLLEAIKELKQEIDILKAERK